MARDLLGETGELIVEDLLRHGQSQASQVHWVVHSSGVICVDAIFSIVLRESYGAHRTKT